MESIYVPNLNRALDQCVVFDNEFKHVKALRLKIHEQIIITDGKGFSVLAELQKIDKNSVTFYIIQELPNKNENQYDTALAIGVLDNKDRMEFAIEKAVELGINSIFPLRTRYTQKSKTSTSRLLSKSIAAMKQCRRSCLPEIFEPINLKSLKEISEKYSKVVLLDETGNSPCLDTNNESILIVVGPEGGFSLDEIKEMKTLKNLIIWNLGERRLRTETAVISGLATILFLMNNK